MDAAASSQRAPPGSAPQRTYHALCDRLADGRLSGGSRLVHRALARELGVTPHAVRLAVAMLQGNGLASSDGQWITAPDRNQCVEILATLKVLEPHALAVCLAVDAAHVARLATLLESGADLIAADLIAAEGEPPTTAWSGATLGFYRTLFAPVHNATLRTAILDLRLQLSVGLRELPTAEGEAARTWLFHTRIVNALHQGDPVAAAFQGEALLRWQFCWLTRG